MPPFLTYLTTWHLDPVALVVLALVAVLYARGLVALRRRGIRWPVWRIAGFYVLGLGSYAWISFGFLGAYSAELRWAFTTRIALLLVAVPGFIGLGKPVALARLALGEAAVARLDRFLDSWLIRLTGNAVFEPIFTFALFMMFLTPLSGVVRGSLAGQWGVSILIPVIGLLTVIPIIENTTRHTSFFVSVEFVLAFAAFVFDAIPGILLRINEAVLDGVGAVPGVVPGWFPNPLRDQQLSGDILWLLAEVLDVPVLIILLIRWNKVERRESKSIDDLSDEEVEALTRAHLRGSGLTHRD
ncbi:cytochrome c oxidase assembly protein [Cryobacterium algoritolerans]|uniref:cytochrome c oxidase assembly protein n=1 Tax=Cryobacterium algoritolerans TaxID=1259184 RepID=UPI001F543912|nr:cytochrome c oxidase assembly protein [Cryobacterium algoritolerans]